MSLLRVCFPNVYNMSVCSLNHLYYMNTELCGAELTRQANDDDDYELFPSLFREESSLDR